MKVNSFSFTPHSLVFILLLAFHCSPSKKFEKTTECMLSMTVFSLEFVHLTTTMQFNLTFQSNCKDYLHHAYFVIPFSKLYRLTDKQHPSKVMINFAGQNYEFKYWNMKNYSKASFSLFS